jgi:HAD superfamily hydrolase (TIGR01509 family)
MIHAAIFDMDGLLLDTERLAFELLNELLQEYNLEVDRATYGTFVGLPKDAFPAALGEALHLDSGAEDLCNRFYDTVHERIHGSQPPLKNGAIEILSELKGRAFPMALATSTYHQMAMPALRSTGIHSFFDHIITGDQIDRGKPAPDIFLKAAEHLQTDPASIVVFEDSPKGIAAAHSAGSRPILIPDLAEPSEREMQMAYAVYSSLKEALPHLDEILA